MKLTRRLSSPTAFLAVATSIGIATVVSSAAPASAIAGPVTLNFVCASVTPINAALCPIGQSQFKAVVSAVGTNQAKFSFTNVGPVLTSSIIKVDIFDKPQNSLGNRFSVTGAGSSVLFGSNSSLGVAGHFISTATGANAVQRGRGINPGESLDIVFNIATAGFNKPFNAVVTDLFHKGLTVQLTGAGFVPPVRVGSNETQGIPVVFNSKVQAVPEPLTMLGSGAALGFGALMKRRSSKLKAKKAGNMPVETALEAVV
jgi:hypothetical protein